MWSAAAERKFTDIEFFVGDQVFPAHKAIVAAHSPVFNAMFTTDMKSNQVKIDDIDPKTFHTFLKFLYTGILEGTPDSNQQLLIVADKYQVKTLTKLRLVATEGFVNESLSIIAELC